MPDVISSDRAQKLGITPEGLVDRVLEFAAAVVDEARLSGEWATNLPSYLLALLCMPQLPMTTTAIAEHAAAFNARVGGRVQPIDNLANRLSSARWEPLDLISAAAALCHLPENPARGWVIDEFLAVGNSEAHTSDLADRVAGTRWAPSAPENKRGVVVVQMHDGERIGIGVVGAGDRHGHVPAEAVLQALDDFSLGRVRTGLGVELDRPVVSYLLPKDAWVALRVWLSEQKIAYVLPVPVTTNVSFRPAGGEESWLLSNFFRTLRSDQVAQGSGQDIQAVETIVDDERAINEWLHADLRYQSVGDRRTGQPPRSFAWVLSRDDHGERQHVARRLEEAKHLAAADPLRDLTATWISAGRPRNDASWMRHCALAVVAATFLVWDRAQRDGARRSHNS